MAISDTESKTLLDETDTFGLRVRVFAASDHVTVLLTVPKDGHQQQHEYRWSACEPLEFVDYITLNSAVLRLCAGTYQKLKQMPGVLSCRASFDSCSVAYRGFFTALRYLGTLPKPGEGAE